LEAENVKNIKTHIPLHVDYGWITATRHWLDSQPACLSVSSLSSTRLPGLLLDFGAQSILQTLWKFSLATSIRAH